ncbi:hypothetical protein ABK046_50055, partial [Streptomyces caeruleatus]
MTNSIKNIATQVISEMTKTSIKDVDMLNCQICSVITNENISFETEKAYNQFKAFIIRQILFLDEQLYRTI